MPMGKEDFKKSLLKKFEARSLVEFFQLGIKRVKTGDETGYIDHYFSTLGTVVEEIIEEAYNEGFSHGAEFGLKF